MTLFEMDFRIFYDYSCTSVKDISVGYESELSDTSDYGMELDKINYFEDFATHSRNKG